MFERLGAPVELRHPLDDAAHPTLAAVNTVEIPARDNHVHGYLFEGNFSSPRFTAFSPPPAGDQRASEPRPLRPDRSSRRSLVVAVSRRPCPGECRHRRTRDIVVEHEWCPLEKTDLISEWGRLAVTRSARRGRPDQAGRRPARGMVGRLGWKKGYEFALMVFATLRERILGLRVDIIGDGNLRGELECASPIFGSGTRCGCRASRATSPLLLERFDCVSCSPPSSKGCRMLSPEAMAMRFSLPTTSAGQRRGRRGDGVSGLLVLPARRGGARDRYPTEHSRSASARCRRAPRPRLRWPGAMPLSARSFAAISPPGAGVRESRLPRPIRHLTTTAPRLRNLAGRQRTLSRGPLVPG